MNAGRTGLTRRQFLGTASAAAATALGRSPRAVARDPAKRSQGRTVLSFYCDDTNPYVAGAKPFEVFLDYCAEHRLAGESSTILGMGGHSMCRKPNEEEQAFLHQVAQRLEMRHRHAHGIDDAPRPLRLRRQPRADRHWARGALALRAGSPRGAIPALLRQHHRGRSASGRQVHRTHLAWLRLRRLHAARMRNCAGAHKEPNPAMWTALLNLAKEGKFRGRTVPCFFGSSETDYGIHRKAADGEHAVFDLMPNAKDCFGIWENNPARVDPDYYISANGKSGIVVRHVEAHAALLPLVLALARTQSGEGSRLASLQDGGGADRQTPPRPCGLDAAQRDHRPLSRSRRVGFHRPGFCARP